MTCQKAEIGKMETIYGVEVRRMNGIPFHPKPRKRSIISFLVWMGILAVVICTIIAGCDSEPAWAEGITLKAFTTEASYFTRASCLREGTSGIMANGERLTDASDQFIAASWDYKFGTKLRITRLDRKDLSCIVVVTDRGPSKRLYRLGRKIDISLAAAKALQMVKSGVVKVTVEVVGG